MRFKDLSQEATQSIWGKWKYLIREVLDEFNEDVYQGRGNIRENSYNERSYLSLETKKECLYVFPVPGNALLFSVYRHKIQQERLKLKFAGEKPDDEENLIGGFGLGIGGVSAHSRAVKTAFQTYLENALRKIYRNYWIKPLL